MIVTIAKVADVDQFLKTFSTKGAEKRREHGSKGSQVFREVSSQIPGKMRRA